MNVDPLQTASVVTQIYRSATGRQDWESTLHAIAQICDAFTVQLLAIDKRSTTSSSTKALFSHVGGPVRPEHHLAYLRTYQHIDPRALLIISPREKDWFHCHEYVSDEEVARSTFYQDFLIPAGGRYLSAVPVFGDDSMAAMLCVIRGVGKVPLEEGMLQWLDGLRPHFTEAMAIYRHLSELHAQSVAGQLILDRLSHPVMLVDAARGLRFANAAGTAAIAAQKAIRASDGKLRAIDARDDKALASALDTLVVAAPDRDLPERRFVRLRGAGAGDRFGISLSALRPSETGGAFGPLPLAMLVLHDGNQVAQCDPFVLQELFDLTPAEADVGVMLSKGSTPEQIATQRGVALATVRSQLRSLMDKTGTRRQSDLVRRLLTLPHGLDGV